MDNYIDQLPLELRIEIYHFCDYPTRIIFYSFLTSTTYRIDPLNRPLNNEEIKEILKYDNPLLIELILNKTPDKPYINNFFGNIDNLYINACQLNCINILKYFLYNISDISKDIYCNMMDLFIANTCNEEVSYLYNKKIGPSANLFLILARCDKFDLFKILREKNLKINQPLFPSDQLTKFLKINKYSDKLIFNTIKDKKFDNKILKDKNFVNTCYIRNTLKKIYSEVAFNGNIDFLEYLWNIEKIDNSKYISSCMKSKHINVIDWSISKLIPFNTKYCSEAARSGDINLLTSLENKGCPWDPLILYVACESGNILMYDYIINNWNKHYDHPLIIENKLLLNAIIKSNSLEMLEYINLIDISPILTNISSVCEILDEPITTKNIILYKTLVKKFGNYNDNFIIYELSKISSKQGHLDFFMYLYELNQDDKRNFYYLYIAAEYKQYHIIDFMLSKKVKPSYIIINKIISNKSLSMIKYLINKNTEFNQSNLDECSYNDNLDIFILLKHLFYQDFIKKCIIHGALKILKYINDNIIKILDYSKMVNNLHEDKLTLLAFSYNQHKVLKWFISIGVTTNNYSFNEQFLTNILENLY